MHIVLAHGMGRTPVSLALLASRLRGAGFSTSSFGYSVALSPVATIVERLIAHVGAAVATRSAARYAIVSHSLGGVLTRAASPRLPAGFARLVMLAPPNAPSPVARSLGRSIVFRAITRDAGARLADPAFYDQLPIPRVPTLVIAGNAGPRLPFLPFGDAPHDGVVAVADTHLPGAAHREVPCIHTFIMNDRAVTAMIVEFLRADA